MKKESNLDLFQNFIEKEQQRSKIQIGGEIQAIFDYCQYIIHTQYDKQSKNRYKFKQRKKDIPQDFMRAFGSLDRQDKIMYYVKNVIYLVRLKNGNFKMPSIRTDVLETVAYTKSYNLGNWKQKKMKLDNSRQVIYGQRNNVVKQYHLSNYIFRGSKNTKFYIFVLEAIRQNVNKKMKTVHIGFESYETMKLWADAVQVCIDYTHWQRIYVQLFKKPPPKQTKSQSNVNLLTSPQFKTQPQQKIIYSKPNQDILPRNQAIYPSLKEQKKQRVRLRSKSKSRPKNKNNQNEIKDQEYQQFYSDSSSDKNDTIVNNHGRTIIQDLVQGQSLQDRQMIQNRNEKQQYDKTIRNLNIFHRMFPEFQFNQVEQEVGYQTIHNEQIMRILQSLKQKNKYKLILELQAKDDIKIQQLFKVLTGVQFLKGFNQNVEQVSVKAFISSENAAIMYMVLKAFNRLYRGRDFVFIRHCFKRGGNQFYIADKEIQNQNYPPFITIVRGKYEAVWTVLKLNQNKFKIIGNVMMDNCGYLNDNQNANLVLNYLRSFNKLPQFAHINLLYLKKFSMFALDWDITKNKINQQQNQIRIKRKTQRIQSIKIKQIANNRIQKNSYTPNLVMKEVQIIQPVPVKTQRQRLASSFAKQKQLFIQKQKMNNGQVQGQIDPKQLEYSKLQTNSQVKLRFDQNGMVIIEKGFIKCKYQLVPTKQYPIIIWESPITGTHPIWVNDWKHDAKNGGLLFINQKKIDDQKGVIKFILSKIGKNLLSGKSVLNISLPVDIFTSKSNLQLFIQSICYAPILLEKAVRLSPFEKFKFVATFGVSLSLLYLIMEKPFNPILGQTFQGWINGCPAYAQQISHHPPICSLLFYGRGYTISGQFQSKAQVHMNSATGTNEGVFKITFNDGTKICYSSAGGQVSGLTYGDRKFNVQGKGYCWAQKQNYFTQIVYNPSKKGFFSMKKQQQPDDYFQGDIYQVSSSFIMNLQRKRTAPTQKQIKSQLGKFKGTWHRNVYYNQQLLLDINNQLPCKLQYQRNPLPSDSNWRQDIAYRRLMQVTRAQTQKQRLEVFQRNDRKLREKKK